MDGDMGIFTVLPEKRTVHYQRKNSAFAQHAMLLDWGPLLDGPGPWLHVTGITPLISDAAQQSWVLALQQAID